MAHDFKAAETDRMLHSPTDLEANSSLILLPFEEVSAKSAVFPTQSSDEVP